MAKTMPTYAAVLTISTADETEPIEIELILHASDSVTVDGTQKLLRDCTLAELQQYADQLEVETFGERSIEALVEDEDVDIAIAATDESGQLPEDWMSQVVIIAAVDEATADDGESDQAEIEDIPVVSAESSDDDEIEEIIVADSSAVRAEIEAEESDDKPTTVDTDSTLGSIGNSQGDDATDILLNSVALVDMQRHAKGSMRREVAGFLLGPQPEKQPNGRYVVHVTDTVVAKHTVMRGASVTYTPDSWATAHNDRLAKYPDDDIIIVGWYHTHPGFGIFLSGMDLFIHHNFFTQPWHIAYVLDPVGETTGFFNWDRTQAEMQQYPFPWPTASWERR